MPSAIATTTIASSASDIQLAIKHHQANQLKQAQALYRNILKQDPDNFDANHLLGVLLSQQNKLTEAIFHLKKAMAIQPQCAQAYNNLGTILQNQYKLAAAIDLYQKAIAIKPQYVEAYSNLALALQEQGEIAAATKMFNKAIALRPEDAEVHLNLGLLQLITHDFQTGWHNYQYRYHPKRLKRLGTRNISRYLPKTDKPFYNDANIANKTIYIYPEQGYGDMIMFARFFHSLAHNNNRIIFYMHNHGALLRLFHINFKNIKIVTESYSGEYDYHMPLMNAGGAFQITDKNTPLTQGYLKADPTIVKHYQQSYFSTHKKKIGLVWKGSTLQLNDQHRSIALDLFLKQLKMHPDHQYYALQQDVTPREAQLLKQYDIDDLGKHCHDFLDTACMIDNLDLVITVDTATAHLSAALGVTTWIMLRKTPLEWRWGCQGETSYWYSKIKLFRQTVAGQWQPVFDHINKYLAHLPHRTRKSVIVENVPMNVAIKRALKHYKAGESTQAQTLCQAILQQDAEHFDANHLLAIIYYQQNKLIDAITSIKKALTIKPQSAEAYNNLGIIMQKQGKIEAAIKCYTQAIAIKPQCPDAYNNLGNALKDQHKTEEALKYYYKALSIKPQCAEIYNNLGTVLQAQSHFTDAIKNYKQAIAINPQYVEAYSNLGLALQEQGEVAAAIKHYRQAIALRPQYTEAYINLSFLQLATRNFQAGWQNYQYRYHPNKQDKQKFMSYFPGRDKPFYDGTAIKNKTIYLYTEQGYGDMIMFSRFLNLLPYQNNQVILYLHKKTPLLRLFQLNFNNVKFITEPHLREYDFHMPLMDAGSVFHITDQNIPLTRGYLKADCDAVKCYQQLYFNTAKNKIGLVWKGSTTQRHDRYRSIALDLFLKQLKVSSKNQIFSLQQNITPKEMQLLKQYNIDDLGKHCHDFLDTAGMIDNLDLVITVDTAIAHLSAALGVTTWIMLRKTPLEWRWGYKGDTSYWYSKIKLFRQAVPGQWQLVFDDINKHLVYASHNTLHNTTQPVITEQLPINVVMKRALAHQEAGELDQSQTLCQTIIKHKADHFDANHLLAIIYYQQNKLTTAIALLNKALTIKPHNAEIYNNLGIVIQNQGNIKAALKNYHRAIALQPQYADAYFNLSLLQLATGDFQAGWQNYQYRYHSTKQNVKKFLPYFPDTDKPFYNGATVENKTIYIYAEQGYGDMLMFARFFHLLARNNNRIIFYIHNYRPLLRLFQLNFKNINIVTKAYTQEYDFHMPLMNAGSVLHITDQNIPATAGYLKADTDIVKHYQQYFNIDKNKIGLVWKGGKAQQNDNYRSIALDMLLKELKIYPDYQYYALQQDITPEETLLLQQYHITDLGKHCHDFLDTACMIYNLDLVITVDTATAHLSAALGKTTWVMLRKMTPVEWHWSHKDNTPCWYDTIKLFQQTVSGQWQSVFKDINAQLAQLPHDRLQPVIIAEKISTHATIQRAVQHHKAGELDQAQALYQKILQQDAGHFDANHLLGMLYCQQNQLTQSIALMNKALTIKPQSAGIYNNLGVAMQRQGKVAAAIKHYTQAIAIRPQYADAYNNLGNAFKDQHEIEAAIKSYHQALVIKPQYAEVHNSLGMALQVQAKIADAIKHYKQAIKINPQYVEVYSNLGLALQEQGQTASAVKYYRQAIAIKPDCAEAYFNLGFLQLSTRNFKPGWQNYQYRYHPNKQDKQKFMSYFPETDKPFYDGTAVKNKTIYLYTEQGYGDMLMFARFLKVLPHQDNQVILYLHKKIPLLRLLQLNFNNIKFITKSYSGEYDFHMPLMNAGGIFNITDQNIPFTKGYLKADCDTVKHYQQLYFNTAKNKIGLVWQGNKMQQDDKYRSITLDALLKQLKISPEHHFFALQQDITPEEALLLQQYHIDDLGTHCHDFLDTACMIYHLDLVITVDTATAHLSAALGKTTWVMLRKMTPVEWHWSHKDNTPYWYDSIKLFQQTVSGQWQPVFKDINAQLAQLSHDRLQPVVIAEKISTHATIQRAVQHHKAGELDQAHALCHEILKSDAHHFDSIHLLGLIVYQQHKWEQAVIFMEKAISIQPQNAEIYHNLGNMLRRQGKIATAIKYYTQAIAIKPQYTDAYNNLSLALQKQEPLTATIEQYIQTLSTHPQRTKIYNNLGLALQKQRQIKTAIQYYQQVIAIHPQCAEMYNNLGLALQYQGEIATAIEQYKQAIAIDSQYPMPYYNLGLLLYKQGKVAAAIRYYKKVISIQPQYADAYNNLGLALQKQGKITAAIKHYNQAITLQPQYADAYNNLGLALQAQGQVATAIKQYTQALRLKPQCAEIYNNLGLSLQAQGKITAAIKQYTQALNIHPRCVEAYNNLGAALQEQGKTAAAAKHYARAIAISPRCSEAYNNWGNIFKNQGKVAAAIKYYNQAIAINPQNVDAYFNLGLLQLAIRDFQPGWQNYQYRYHPKKQCRTTKLMSYLSAIDNPLYNGATIENKTMYVYTEQGFGDIIMFARFLNLLPYQNNRIILYLHTQKPLLRLLQLNFKNIDLITEPYRKNYDCHMPLMNAGGILHITDQNMPFTESYLKADHNTVKRYQKLYFNIDKQRIGLVWKGNTNQKHDKHRSITLDIFLKKLNINSDNQFVSLQQAVTSQETQLLEKYHITDLGKHCHDFLDTACMIDNLDLVITVDTATAHLSAALGKTTWVMLRKTPLEWRWGYEDDTSYWYDSMKLFRQTVAGRWQSVFDEINQHLSQDLNETETEHQGK